MYFNSIYLKLYFICIIFEFLFILKYYCLNSNNGFKIYLKTRNENIKKKNSTKFTICI